MLKIYFICPWENDNSLLNKKILITGGSSGIGADAAKMFSNCGASIILLGRSETNLNNVFFIRKLGSFGEQLRIDINKSKDKKIIIKPNNSVILFIKNFLVLEKKLANSIKMNQIS